MGGAGSQRVQEQVGMDVKDAGTGGIGLKSCPHADL